MFKYKEKKEERLRRMRVWASVINAEAARPTFSAPLAVQAANVVLDAYDKIFTKETK